MRANFVNSRSINMDTCFKLLHVPGTKVLENSKLIQIPETITIKRILLTTCTIKRILLSTCTTHQPAVSTTKIHKLALPAFKCSEHVLHLLFCGGYKGEAYPPEGWGNKRPSNQVNTKYNSC